MRLPLLLAAVLLGALPLAGCGHTSEMAATRRAVARAYPDARFERRVAVSAGPLTMGLARTVLGMTGDSTARALRPLLRHVRRVRVRVYEAAALGDAAGAVRMPGRLAERGWQPVVRVRDGAEGSAVWVCVRERRGRLTSVFVSALSDGDLVLVQADGDLEGLIAQAIDFGLERGARGARADTVAARAER